MNEKDKQNLLEKINFYLYHQDLIINSGKYRQKLSKKLKKYLNKSYKGLNMLEAYREKLCKELYQPKDILNMPNNIICALKNWNDNIDENFWEAWQYLKNFFLNEQDFLNQIEKESQMKITNSSSVQDISIKLAISTCFPNELSFMWAKEFFKLFPIYSYVYKIDSSTMLDEDKIMLINELKMEKDAQTLTLERFNYEFK